MASGWWSWPRWPTRPWFRWPLRQALGVREVPGKPVADTLVDYLRPRRLLLILDNCEHLVEACASLADRPAARPAQA